MRRTTSLPSLPCLIIGALLSYASPTSSQTTRATVQPDCSGVETNSPRALTIRYADGRESRSIVHVCGRSWTPAFPVIDGAATNRDGLALAALQTSYRADGADVVITISLLYGRPHQKEITVETVRLSGESPVTVTALSDYGVQPVTLWLGGVASTVPDVPIGTSVSPSLDVRVSASVRHEYMIAITNTSQRNVMALQLEGRRADRRISSAMPMDPLDEPLIRSGATLERRASPSGGEVRSGEWAPEGLSEFAVTAVRWDDGVIEGDVQFATAQAAVLSGRRVALRHAIAILAALSAIAEPSAQVLRERLSSMPISVSREESAALLRQFTQIDSPDPDRFRASMSVSQQLVKDRLVQQLDTRFPPIAKEPSHEAIRAWIADVREFCEGWLRRLPPNF